MALELLAAFGAGANDITLYDVTGGGLTGWSVVAIPAPDQGNYRIKCVGNGGSGSPVVSEDLLGFSAKTYQWPCLRTWRMDGTLTAAQQFRLLDFGLGLELWWKYISGSTFNLGISGHLTANRTYSSTVFSTGTDYTIRAQGKSEGGGLYSMKLWVDGVLEVNQGPSEGAKTSNNVRPVLPLQPSNVTMYWENGLVVQSDSESDRPGTDVWIDIITPSGDTGGSYDAYGDDTNCGIGSTTGNFGAWDDYAGGGTPVDVDDFNCEDPGGGGAQASSLTTVSPSGTTLGVIWRGRGLANVAAKVVSNTALVLDSDGTPNEATVTNRNVDTDDWEGYCAVFDVEPGGSGTWDIANLQAGIRSSAANGAADEWSALCLEVVAVNSDPPPSSIGKTKANSAALGSAQAGIY